MTEWILTGVFVIPILLGLAFMVVAATVMKRDEEEGRRQVEARRMRLEARRAAT